MDWIDGKFTNYTQDESLNVALRSAVKAGKDTLNKYYELTDDSEVYRIAMSEPHSSYQRLNQLYFFSVLHPRNKLHYFKKAKWPKYWIRTAEELVRDRLEDGYEEFGPHPSALAEEGARRENTPSVEVSNLNSIFHGSLLYFSGVTTATKFP